MADHDAYCEALVREADKDRFLATLFALQQYRPALFAIYAFDVEIGRIAHLVKEPMAGEIRLQWWHDVVTGTAHAAGSPVATALIETMRSFDLPAAFAVEAIEAHRDTLPGDGAAPPDLQTLSIRIGRPIFDLAARILNDGADAECDRLCAVAAAAFALMRVTPLDAAARAVAASNLAEARELLAQTHERLWPAFLPLALLPQLLRRGAGRDLPQWRRQWILWRAARNLPNALV